MTNINNETVGTSSSNWKNVNNWHWIEKDCTAWSHERLREILGGLVATYDEDRLQLSVKSLHDLRGDVSVAQRKGRVRQIYDLSFDLKWTATTNKAGDDSDRPADPKDADASVLAKGKLSISDFMSDTDPADLEYTIDYEQDRSVGEGREALRRALKAFATETIWDAVHGTFGEALIATHGQALLVEEGSSASSSPAGKPPQSRPKYTGNSIGDGDGDGDVTTTTALGSIEQKVEFNAASPADIFRALTDPGMVRVWSRTPDPGPLTPGTPFALFGGAVRGDLLEADPASHTLRMTWRLAHWAQPSTVQIRISGGSGEGVVLWMHQDNVPKAEVEGTRTNWTNYYWNPIKSAFGYGIVSFN